MPGSQHHSFSIVCGVEGSEFVEFVVSSGDLNEQLGLRNTGLESVVKHSIEVNIGIYLPFFFSQSL